MDSAQAVQQPSSDLAQEFFEQTVTAAGRPIPNQLAIRLATITVHGPTYMVQIPSCDPNLHQFQRCCDAHLLLTCMISLYTCCPHQVANINISSQQETTKAPMSPEASPPS